MKTLLLSSIKERFYWHKNSESSRTYILYDNERIHEKYFGRTDDMMSYMINELHEQNPLFFPPYSHLVEKRALKRHKKAKKKLQAKYASKFNKKHGK